MKPPNEWIKMQGAKGRCQQEGKGRQEALEESEVHWHGKRFAQPNWKCLNTTAGGLHVETGLSTVWHLPGYCSMFLLPCFSKHFSLKACLKRVLQDGGVNSCDHKTQWVWEALVSCQRRLYLSLVTSSTCPATGSAGPNSAPLNPHIHVQCSVFLS